LHTFKTSGTTWFLEDRSLERVVEQFGHEPMGRRAHFISEYPEGKVFIKFFQERGLSGLIRNRVLPRGKKEYELSKKLLSLSVLTPKALGYGLAPRGSYVIQEWIDGEPLLVWMDDKSRRQQLMSAIAAVLEQLKSKGFRHNDLHLANIIGASDNIYLVDLHKGSLKKKFSFADDVSNVSHALAMVYDSMLEEEKAWFFNRYGGNALRSKVELELARLRQRWIERKAARAFRTTSVILASRNRVTVRGMEEKAHGEYMATIKKDRKVTVERYADHVRKIYAHRRRLHRAWKNHVILEYMRLLIAPRPYYLQHASVSAAGYIAMEDLAGKGEELDRFLDRNYDEMNRAERSGFIDVFSSFLLSVFSKKITHLDLKACNVFVLGRGAFLFLDVEDFDFFGFDSEAVKRMLIQLNTTIPRRISIRDRLRFFVKVTESLLSKPARKGLFSEIASESLTREIVYEGVGGLKKEAWK
jgi:tRNA A-37 threonylcarbamoyl transferase component Bud32